MPARKRDPLLTFLTDPRMHELSAIQTKILMCVMSLLASAPVAGRVSFLRSVAVSVSRWVSVSEPISETDTETHLRTLEGLGLIEVDWEGSGIALPGQAEREARAERARINGKSGGRRLKGETREECLKRRQGHLTLPIEGGLSETQKTQNEPTRESSRAVTTSSSSKEGSSTAREASASVSLGHELAEIAGMNAVSGGYDFSWVRGWLSQGATPDMIRQAVRGVAARKGYAGAEIHTFKYFDAAVQRAMQHRAARPAGGDELLERMAQDDRQARMIAYANGRGPRPAAVA